MSFRRVNRSKKVPGVKLRPAGPSSRKEAPTPDPSWTHSSGLDSDDETTNMDICPRPFKGFVLCATGISDKTSLFKLALELGAQCLSDLTDRVTHLIAEEAGSPKYRFALENRIPIMRPSWIIESHQVWLHGDDVDVPFSIKQHRLPPFTGVVLCVSGIEDVSKRMQINHEVTKAGGMYVKQLERPVKVTHLLCANTSEGETEKVRYAQKFNEKGEARIRIVWEDWFWDSLRFGGRFDEERYLVSNPRPPPRVLPAEPMPAATSSSAPDDSGLSSEIHNAQTSAVRPNSSSHQAAQEEEEIASGRRVPAMTLHLWESILKPRGFEVQGGRLVRSPSKSQNPEAAKAAAEAQRRAGSPSRAGPSGLGRRGTLKNLDADEGERRPSALSTFQRSRSSFLPAPKDVSTPVGGVRLFQRNATMSRTSSFLQRSVGSVMAQGGISTDIPIASTSAIADAAPEDADADALSHGTGVTDGAKVIFSGLRFRALGEARCANVKSAIEECGGTWVGVDDDDDVDFVVVRLVSGSNIFRQESDEEERAKYRTECWLERCMFEERICAPEEHVAFTPLKVEVPVPRADEILLSCSGLDHAETCTVRRLLRALGIGLAPAFSRRSTHLLCPSGEGAKAEKAREWGTPIVDMAWLAAIANTGEIPPTQPSAADDDALDLPVAQGSWMAPEPTSVAKTDTTGKGKEKARDDKMVDITNAESAPRSQSLSYYDPPPDDERPGQAEQMEAFGMPSMLLGQSQSLTRPPTPSKGSAKSAARLTQASEPQDDAVVVSIPSKLSEDRRVPSSASPSPLRMPGLGTPRDHPSTPVKVTKQVTAVIQERITSLLGKRRSEEEQGGGERQESGPAKLQGHDSRRDGKRSRPLQRTRSNMSYSELISPPYAAKGKGVARNMELPFAQALAVESQQEEFDEAENSFLAAEREAEGAVRVAYADPRENGELERLKVLFQSGGKGAEPRKEGWEVEMSMEMDAEVTLPQLPDVLAASGSGSRKDSGSRAGRSRRGRGRRGAKA
ncbi:hypothetical protein K466DRAFT_666976 [Polyporus arcularius HHB13444]|uniref:BRCT domain-containing protein n=1 Tax=Polyporus arcularius HHB13444 TaxID=1314778 RepID=A0A5C3NWF1_9APHY|nr:hypothetical protein K466DRAFT_666976 [Polyporus arcularius HHB13444]